MVNRRIVKNHRIITKEIYMDGGKRLSKFDVIGNKYGKLTVEGTFIRRGKHNEIYCRCRCECGNEHVESRNNLIELKVRSCGCVPKSNGKMIGKKYSLITVLDGVDELAARRCPKFLCRCDCGKRFLAKGADIMRGRIISCGCVAVDKEDFIGKKIGKVKVQSIFDISKSGLTRYRCRCSCRKICIKTGEELSSGKDASCGCDNNVEEVKPIKDEYGLVGSRFDTLTVTCAEDEGGLNATVRYKCTCDCGSEYTIGVRALVTGRFCRCGCK